MESFGILSVGSLRGGLYYFNFRVPAQPNLMLRDGQNRCGSGRRAAVTSRPVPVHAAGHAALPRDGRPSSIARIPASPAEPFPPRTNSTKGEGAHPARSEC